MWWGETLKMKNCELHFDFHLKRLKLCQFVTFENTSKYCHLVFQILSQMISFAVSNIALNAVIWCAKWFHLLTHAASQGEQP